MQGLPLLPHIRQHSLVVCDVALHIARLLNQSGARLNLADIEAAALLHDITKTASLETGEDHARSGAALLGRLGYARIAEIVAAHIVADSADPGITEDEVVCYADKRVLHDTIVSLDERFAYLRRRYGRTRAALNRVRAMERRIRAIERKLLVKLNIAVLDVSGIAGP
jgi:putative nucleotidyltransferase with HDIG domain